MKKLLSLLAFLLVTSCATTDNLGDLSKRFDDIKKIANITKNELLQINGFKDKTAENIINALYVLNHCHLRCECKMKCN